MKVVQLTPNVRYFPFEDGDEFGGLFVYYTGQVVRRLWEVEGVDQFKETVQEIQEMGL